LYTGCENVPVSGGRFPGAKAFKKVNPIALLICLKRPQMKLSENVSVLYKIGYILGYTVAMIGMLVNYVMFPFPRG
jgi:hypothetical protein